MTFGLIAGTVNTDAIGASYLGRVAYGGSGTESWDITVPGIQYMSVFSFLACPAMSYSAMDLVIMPTVTITRTATGVTVSASGGSIQTSILVFGR